jgi:hypothetical protein
MAMNEPPRNGSPTDEPIDPGLARLYRESAREEPPARLDAAIRAAARRETGARPRELAPAGGEVAAPRASGPAQPAHPLARPFRWTWRLPLSLAAVMVLSVSVVTLMMEQDGERTAEPSRSASQPRADGTRTPELRSRTLPAPGEPASRGALHDRRDTMGAETARSGEAQERTDAAQLPAPPAALAREKAEAEATRTFRAPAQSAVPRAEGDSTAASSPPSLASKFADQPPEKWGEKIVELRRQGRSAEADELLAEFRRRFPGQIVPDEWMP